MSFKRTSNSVAFQLLVGFLYLFAGNIYSEHFKIPVDNKTYLQAAPNDFTSLAIKPNVTGVTFLIHKVQQEIASLSIHWKSSLSFLKRSHQAVSFVYKEISVDPFFRQLVLRI